MSDGTLFAGSNPGDVRFHVDERGLVSAIGVVRPAQLYRVVVPETTGQISYELGGSPKSGGGSTAWEDSIHTMIMSPMRGVPQRYFGSPRPDNRSASDHGCGTMSG